MPVIQTLYGSVLFRSRLEARWALYFDVIGIAWEYEKEGYEFADGTRYLPDFWLPQVCMWAEVKPETFTVGELHKAKCLVRETGFPCLMLDGMPALRSYGAVSFWKGELIVGAEEGNDYVLSMYHAYPLTERRFYGGTGGTIDPTDFAPLGMFNDVPRAVTAALSERFEMTPEEREQRRAFLHRQLAWIGRRDEAERTGQEFGEMLPE